MNNHRLGLTAAVLLAVVLLAGCFSASPPVFYYSLYAPAQPPASGATGSPLAISVGPVTLPDILKQAQIATGGQDGRYRLAAAHRWSGELDRDLARTVAEQLAAGLGTEQVAIFPWDQRFAADYRVFIDVLNLGGEPGAAAILTVRWVLSRPGAAAPLLVRRSEWRAIPDAPGYAAWVVAQQRNVAALGREITAAIQDAAGSRP